MTLNASKLREVAAFQYAPGAALPANLKAYAVVPGRMESLPPNLRPLACRWFTPGQTAPDSLRPIAAVMYKPTDVLPAGIELAAGVAPDDTPISDTFTRADSNSSLGSAETGQAYTVGQGTWGISSGQAYSATDADGDIAYVDAGAADVTVSCVVSGQVASGTDFRIADMVYRIVDATHCLRLFMISGQLRLGKIEAGVATTLASTAMTTTDGQQYLMQVVAKGAVITAYVNGVPMLTYTLTGADLQYVTPTLHGMRLRKGGVPTTAARWDNFVVSK